MNILYFLTGFAQRKGDTQIMDKKPFVTLEQLREIERTYPTPFYLYDERESGRMPPGLSRRFPGTGDIRNILRSRPRPILSC